MQRFLLKLADVVLFWAHALIAVGCTFGWMLPGAQKWHLALVIVIGFSWYGLGLRYGIGYCVLTDWQWRARKKLGYDLEHGSFVQLMLESASGLQLNAKQVKMFAYIMYWISAAISVYINFIAVPLR